MTREKRRLVPLAVALAAALLVYGVAIGAPPQTAKVRLPAAVEQSDSVVAYGPSKVLLAGTWAKMLARVDNRGSLDPSFGDGGIVEIQATDVAVDRKGRILVVAGGASAADPADDDAQVTRLLPNGSRDPAFGDAGVARIDFGGHYDYGSAIAVTAEGDILVGGRRQTTPETRGGSDGVPALGRLLPNGALDRSFGRRGVRILKGGWEEGVFDIHPTRNGGVVAMGESVIGISIWRLTESGSPVRRFGDDGVVELDNRSGGDEEWLSWTDEIGVLANGTIVAAATGNRSVDGEDAYRVVVVGLKPNGRIDRSFGRLGWALPSIGGDAFARTLTVLPRGVTVVGVQVGFGPRRRLGLIAFGPRGGPNRRFAGRAKVTVGRGGGWIESTARQSTARPGTNRIVVLGSGQEEHWLAGVPGLR